MDEETNDMSQSSIELKRDAKQNTVITVKVYGMDPNVAKDKAITIYDQLCSRYGVL